MIRFLASARFSRGACCLGLLHVAALHAGPGKVRPKPGHTLDASSWRHAVEAREVFEAEPEGLRTRAAYNRVMAGFRAIYHDDPRDQHAADAARAVADLLDEEGRELNDPALLHSAAGQYAFLRSQYPDSRAARKPLPADPQVFVAAVPASPRRPQPAVVGLALTDENAAIVSARPTPGPSNRAAAARLSSENPRKSLALVSGIRHWSTPTYTRVVIDLGDEVTFEAARVPNPDRIFFDLHGSQLSQELVGRSFTVTDDGFLKQIRAAQSDPGITRVVLDVSDVTEYSAFLLPNPYRLIIDIHGVTPPRSLTSSAARPDPLPLSASVSAKASDAASSSGLPATAPTNGSDALRSPSHPVPNTLAVKSPAATNDVAAVGSAPGRIDATRAPTSKPIAALVPPVKDVNIGSANTSAATGMHRRRPRQPDSEVAGDAAPAKPADRTASGETSMIRALGLKINRIVIDAGHGGHDSGTLGVGGIEEKDIVLDVALRLGKLLQQRTGAQIIYTRSDDTFIPLETRTAIANKAQADLFISIHANSSQDESARGVETYYLNFTSDPAALDVAARENAVGSQSVHQLSDLVKRIALKDKIAESHEFASDVEASLYAGLEKGNEGLKNRGVKKAPFVVLIGANMPSILAEISFVTNPADAAQLRDPPYRERVAESLYVGIARYEQGLAGTKNSAPVQRAAVR